MHDLKALLTVLPRKNSVLDVNSSAARACLSCSFIDSCRSASDNAGLLFAFVVDVD